MNKFTKIKKTLAVSLCSSMLFSGAPKASGMENSLRALNTENSSLRHLSFVGERSVATLDWVLGTVAVALFGYSVSVLKQSSIINRNIIMSDELYCQLKDMIDLIKLETNNNINNNKSVDIIYNTSNINNINISDINDINNTQLVLSNQAIKNQLINNIDSGYYSACKASIEALLHEERDHKIFNCVKKDSDSNCLYGFFRCFCRLSSVCCCCKAKSESEYVKKCKDEVMRCINLALEKFINLDDKSKAKSEKLFDKLKGFIDLAKDSKVPQIQLTLALERVRQFLKKEGVITEKEYNDLKKKINNRKSACCCDCC